MRAQVYRWLAVGLMIIGLIAILSTVNWMIDRVRLPPWAPDWVVRAPFMGLCIVGGPYLVRWAWRRLAPSRATAPE